MKLELNSKQATSNPCALLLACFNHGGLQNLYRTTQWHSCGRTPVSCASTPVVRIQCLKGGHEDKEVIPSQTVPHLQHPCGYKALTLL